MAEGISKFWRTVLFFGKGMEEREKASAIAELIAGLRPFFERREFKYAKPYQAFRRTKGDLQWSFGLGFFVHPDAFTIRPAAAVRHDTIERIFHQVSGAPETVQRDSVTVSWDWPLEKVTPKPWTFTVDRRSQLPTATKFTQNFFVKWVEPFFREHSDLAAISSSYNDNQRILCARVVPDWFDVLGRALIAARLAERSDYDVLKREYQRALANRKSSYPADSFDALVGILADYRNDSGFGSQ